MNKEQDNQTGRDQLFALARLHNNVVAAKQGNGPGKDKSVCQAMQELVDALSQAPTDITKQLKPTD